MLRLVMKPETKPKRLVMSLCHCDQLARREIEKVSGVGEARAARLGTGATLRLRTKLRKVNGQD
jgi:DNA-directed RNA polymerase specialized sigma subunit